jgi:hypothetical protein
MFGTNVLFDCPGLCVMDPPREGFEPSNPAVN